MREGMRQALRWGLTFGGAILLFLVVARWHPTGVAAGTFTVTDNSDNVADPGSLRFALSNLAAGGNTINFNITGSTTITVGSALPNLAQNVTIDGTTQPGWPTTSNVVVDGNSKGAVFTIGNSGVTATFTGLTIQHGSGALDGPPGTPTFGGGISMLHGGTVHVTNCTITNNAVSLNGSGGGIYSQGSSTVTVTGSTFSGNASGPSGTGGGIESDSPAATLTVTNSTFSGNSAGTGGGGINIADGGPVTVTNSTFSGNSASSSRGGINIQNSGTVTLTNTIVANSITGDLAAGGSGTFTGSNNLIDDATSAGGFTDNTNGNIIGHPALLGSLSSNGGPTQTIPLLPGSVAIDAGAAVGSGPGTNPVPATDQRGKSRVGAPDIGAFENQGFTLAVNSAADGGTNTENCETGNASACRLRDAIAVVNAGSSGANPTISFNITGGGVQTITVGSALPALSKNVVIDGTTQPGWPATSSIVVDGNSKGSVFTVNSGVTVTLNGLTIQHGSGTTSGPLAFAGGIDNNGGTLTVMNSTVANNTVIGGVSQGGGIFNLFGTLTVTNSTVANNLGGTGGGGIYNRGTLTVTNSTFSSNSGGSNGGGGIFTQGGTVRVANSTFSGNSAGEGGGIDINDGGTVTLTNTIVANSTGANCAAASPSTITADSHNLADDASCNNASQATSAQINLQPLASNGGPTQTMAVGVGSVAIDAGDDAICNATSGTAPVNKLDQRGIIRPQGAHCDSGAFEARFTLTVTGGSPQTTFISQPFANPLIVTFGGADAPIPPSGAPVTFTANLVAGASATLGTPNPATTIASGQASVTATANGTTGSYTVTASTPGAAAVTFSLTNISATPVVTNSGDGVADATQCIGVSNTTCTLRDAIAAVTGNVATGTTITFDATVFPPAGPQKAIVLNAAGGTLMLNANVTITGPGAPAVAVDGGCTANCGTQNAVGGVPVFSVHSGVVVTISGLTIQKGNYSSLPTFGGGIANDGTLTVTNTVLSMNRAGSGGGFSNAGTLTVINTTFSGNFANDGGGIDNGGTLAVTNSTFTGNTATLGRGGGIRNSGGTLTMTNGTFSGNVALGAGGGIANVSGTLALTNALIAGNTTTGGPASSGPNVSGAIAAGSKNNLIGDGSGMTGITDGTNGNHIGTSVTPINAPLGPLGIYGSVNGTPILPLLPGNPAIDAGDDATCAAALPNGAGGKDQRGITRPQGVHCDIGAFESQGFTLALTSGDNQSAVVNSAFTNPLVVSVAAKNAGEPVQGGQVSFTVVPVSGAGATLTGNPAVIGASGQTSVTATANGTKGSYSVTASATGATGTPTYHLTNTAPLVSIAVIPGTAMLKVGQSQVFTATGTYADNSTLDLTGQVTWSSDANAVASVDASGKATGATAGTAHVKATQGGVSGQASVTVSAPTPVGISVPPAPSGRPSGTTSEPGATPAPSGSGRAGTIGGSAPVSAPPGR